MNSTAETAPVISKVRLRRSTTTALVGGGVAVAAALAIMPYLFDERFFYHIAIMVCFAAIGASSLHLIIRTGHVSLCHAAFIGVGAYVSANVVMKLGLPFVGGLVAGTLAAAGLGLMIGPVILRLTGKYFVLITFLFGEILRMVFVDWQSITGGANGLSGIPAPAPVFAEPKYFYALALLAATACVAICGRILSSETGRFVNAIRESEQLTECVGVPVIRTKVMIFVIACGFAGFAGALIAHYARYISPPNFGPLESLNLVIMNVIGGMQTLVGPLLGAIFLVLVPEFLRGYVQLQHIMFGVILILVMAFLPAGVVGVKDLVARRMIPHDSRGEQ
ncbi:branched-chain amino acid ABC transporter permease [Microvirga sp. KLBC 81]|uniref:branched-chain amino acid ABC transporter permease n=1 Tax=Microvirga sp. KLBC 81 TaxID=1862707 RepID=UPI000D518B9D|nr:branched-chain amino acid ABC transporter permease [Microvirga sp. KLBC 81]PVE22182.1 branched-chain amino acid ABC transporter permease [Microvirga sp. KLBC 81]